MSASRMIPPAARAESRLRIFIDYIYFIKINFEYKKE